MKQQLRTIAILALLSLFGAGAFAQETENAVPRWASDRGYWVVESNIHTPLNHTVRFYNNDNILVYQETLTGVKLNPDRRRTKMKLKKILESSVTAWEKKGAKSEDIGLVKAIL